MPVGEKLAAERRKQGKTLVDVAAATHIMQRLLDALEHGRYEELPSPVYVRGYIQNYAHYLHIDPTPLLIEFQNDIGGRTRDTRLDELPERTVVPMHDQMHHIPRRTWLVIASALIVIGLTLWAISALVPSGETLPPIPPVTTGTVEPTATPGLTTSTAPAATATPEPAAESTATVPGEAFTLSVSVKEGAASWLRVIVDGKKAYEGTLTGGTSKEWTVNTEASVRVGKPGAVTVTKDGAPVALKNVGGVAVATITVSPR
ncbi:MAG: RodZ domain-containing protein [Coriobacteriales bacterium]|nr:DUF4115 domain-containing protein [Actinomycetes bacterium]